jgi:BTB/POZ domain
MNLTESRNNFLDLWEDGSLCDVQLRTVDGAIVPAHRVVLAASSGFFRALFVGSGRQMREGSEDSKPISLTGVNEASLRALLKAVYSNSSTDHLNDDTVLPLLAAASYLSVESVRDACNRYLHRFLSLDTVVETLVLAERYDCADLLDDAVRISWLAPH